MTTIGVFVCTNCEKRTNHTDEDCTETEMRCSACKYLVPRPPPTRLVLRLYVVGLLDMAAVTKLSDVAKVLGASDTAIVVKESETSYYVEMPADHVAAQLEIRRLRGS